MTPKMRETIFAEAFRWVGLLLIVGFFSKDLIINYVLKEKVIPDTQPPWILFVALIMTGAVPPALIIKILSAANSIVGAVGQAGSNTVSEEAKAQTKEPQKSE